MTQGDDGFRWSDAQMLDILDLAAGGSRGGGRSGGGQSAQAIADTYGVSKGSLIGLLYRIRTETDASESVRDVSAPPAERPANRNGGMPARWWSAGLKVQKRRELAARATDARLVAR